MKLFSINKINRAVQAASVSGGISSLRGVVRPGQLSSVLSSGLPCVGVCTFMAMCAPITMLVGYMTSTGNFKAPLNM